MRDMIKDAAMIITAKQIMEDGFWCGVETYVQTYAKGEKDQKQLLDDLYLLGLVYQKFEKGPYELEGKRVWRWINDK